MNKISKILTTSLFLTTALFAKNSDSNVIAFEKDRISQNPQVTVKEISINTKKELPIKGWYGYIFDIKAELGGKPINAKDIVFSDGRYIALDLIDSKNKKSLKSYVTPNLTAKYYDESKLIAGNHNAKDKIVIFSDPLCPFCMDLVPEVIKHVNKNSDSIALYYYHFPLLRLHPAAGPLSKIMEVAREKGLKDAEIKTYETDWDPFFTSKSTDEKKILAAFNKVFKMNIKLEEIQNKELQENMFKDVAMGEEVMVQGTPTIFINGVKDNSRLKYETLGKK